MSGANLASIVAARGIAARAVSKLCCWRVLGPALLVMGLGVVQAPASAQIWPNAGQAEASKARALEALEREAAAAKGARPASAAAPAQADGQPVPAPSVSLAASAPAPAPAPAPTAPAPAATSTPLGLGSEIAPRRVGWTLGDLLTQRVRLPEDLGAWLPAQTDLRAGRVGTWFERRGVRRVTDAEGQPWLHIEHQVINVPPATQAVQLPGFSLAFAGDRRFEVAPLAVSIGPMTPSEEVSVEGTLASLRPDRAPDVPSVARLGQRLRWALAALLGVLLLWLAWWAHGEWRDARAKPFARALRDVRASLQGQGSAPAGSIDAQAHAWVALHHAFNAAAERTVHAASLARLFERQPALLAERVAIEQFFVASNARFFQPHGARESFDVLGLVKRLRRLERQSA